MVAAAHRPHRLDVVAAAQRQRLGPYEPGGHEPRHAADDQDLHGTAGRRWSRSRAGGTARGSRSPRRRPASSTASSQPPAKPETAPQIVPISVASRPGGEPDIQRRLARRSSDAQYVVADVVGAERMSLVAGGQVHRPGPCASGRCGGTAAEEAEQQQDGEDPGRRGPAGWRRTARPCARGAHRRLGRRPPTGADTWAVRLGEVAWGAPLGVLTRGSTAAGAGRQQRADDRRSEMTRSPPSRIGKSRSARRSRTAAPCRGS